MVIARKEYVKREKPPTVEGAYTLLGSIVGGLSENFLCIDGKKIPISVTELSTEADIDRILRVTLKFFVLPDTKIIEKDSLESKSSGFKIKIASVEDGSKKIVVLMRDFGMQTILEKELVDKLKSDGDSSATIDELIANRFASTFQKSLLEVLKRASFD